VFEGGERAANVAAHQPSRRPDHESLVKAKYGDGAARQPRPNPNRGDNLTAGAPYRDRKLVA